ncbi:MAG: RNA-protein complex protein Nop10 [Nanoarchaeota archaeon]|nr:RNA-protein complex protein Nop10 [Nanoarchaeota archaeon]
MTDTEEKPVSTMLRKCPECKTYTMQNNCKKCNSKTKSAHYNYSQIRNAPPRSAPFKRR